MKNKILVLMLTLLTASCQVDSSTVYPLEEVTELSSGEGEDLRNKPSAIYRFVPTADGLKFLDKNENDDKMLIINGMSKYIDVDLWISTDYGIYSLIGSYRILAGEIFKYTIDIGNRRGQYYFSISNEKSQRVSLEFNYKILKKLPNM